MEYFGALVRQQLLLNYILKLFDEQIQPMMIYTTPWTGLIQLLSSFSLCESSFFLFFSRVYERTCVLDVSLCVCDFFFLIVEGLQDGMCCACGRVGSEGEETMIASHLGVWLPHRPCPSGPSPGVSSPHALLVLPAFRSPQVWHQITFLSSYTPHPTATPYRLCPPGREETWQRKSRPPVRMCGIIICPTF